MLIIVRLLLAGVKPNPGSDVAIDSTSLTPNHVPDGSSIQLLEDCHQTNKQVIEVSENDLKMRTEKNIN